MLRVAVTGVGGGVGQSILKALELSDLDIQTLFRIDIKDNAGFYFDSKYATRNLLLSNLKGRQVIGGDWLRAIITEKIDVVIPGSDYDLLALANAKPALPFARHRCRVLVSNAEIVNMCNSKTQTQEWLKRNWLPYIPPWDRSFPAIIKPDIGSGSRGVHKVSSIEELRFYQGKINPHVIQTYLNGSEYTCAVFVDRHGEVVSTFQLKRKLNNGTTYRGEVVFERDIHKLLVDIGRALKPMGVLNVQLRMTETGPIPFELNCRCSGTTAIRSHYGFNEPEMLIRHYVLGEELKKPNIEFGKVFRYWNESYARRYCN